MYYFIVNPKASSGVGLKKWKALAVLLKKNKLPYQVFFTDGAGSATLHARVITSRKEEVMLVAVGGDGTANEVLNGICDFTRTTFGYVPTGSSNDLARAMNLPSEPEEAIKLLLHPEAVRHVNVGFVTSGNSSRRFLVSSGIGFDAAVCHEALNSRLKKHLNRFHLGKLTYLGIALKHILLLKGTPAKLILDDGRRFSFPKVFFCTFMNTKYEGGGFQFCPEAQPDDDLLDICLVEQMRKTKIFRVLPTAYPGKHTRTKEVHICQCRRAHIKTPRPMAVHTDGESFHFQKDLTVGLLDARLRFLAPPVS